MQAKNDNRILFLDYLRAVACLLVVIGHVYVVGPNDPNTVKIWVPTVSGYIFGPDPNGENPYGVVLNNLTNFTGINVGALGVGIFFLISGFVIMSALDREPWTKFLVRRAFRIYPSATAAVLFGATVTAVFCRANHITDPIGFDRIWASSALLNNIVHKQYVSPVMWTLEVEVFFYILVAIIAGQIGKIGRRALLITTIGCALVSLALCGAAAASNPAAEYLAYFGSLCANALLLLVGSMIYRNISAGWSISSWFYVGASIAIYFATHAIHDVILPGHPIGVDAVNSVASLLLFCAALWSGMRWQWIRPLRYVADISYPLYLVHVPTSWIMLTVLAQNGWSIHSAGAVTMLTVLGCAWMLHVSVEKPFQSIGRRVAVNLSHRAAVDEFADRTITTR
jgi:peptidoglycan/LPS O-acetylase OafA/YrhL